MEVWRDIPGYVGLYKVSNRGRVAGLRGLLNPRQYRYSSVGLYKNNEQKYKTVHRLVLLAFVGSSELETRHLDGNNHNNNLWNLKYGTHRENGQDWSKHGIGVGEANGMSKLKVENVIQLKKLLKTDTYFQKDLAKMFDVTPVTISKIKHGELWSHVII